MLNKKERKINYLASNVNRLGSETINGFQVVKSYSDGGYTIEYLVISPNNEVIYSFSSPNAAISKII